MRQERINKILLIPLIILVSIIPLIVRYTQVELTDPQAIKIWGNIAGDLFSQVKAGNILIITGIICMILFFVCSRKYIKVDSYMKIIYISAVIYVVATISSVFLSAYKNTALWGVIDRAEGGIILISYILIMFYGLYVLRDIDNYKYVVGAILVLTICLTILGYYQYIGQDLLTSTNWGKSLIIPEKYKQYRESITLLYDEKRIYGTLFHYNYVGSFAAMIVPLFITLLVGSKQRLWKISCLIGAGCGIFLLLGSTSRAGLIGVVCSCVLAIILFSKIILKNWKKMLIFIVVVIGILIGINQFTKGAIFERIPDLIEDIGMALGIGSEQKTDDNRIPLQNITHEGKAMLLEVGGDTLVIQTVDGNLKFSDAQGKPIIYENIDGIYRTQDIRFEEISFQKAVRAIEDKEVWEILAPDVVFTFVTQDNQGVYLVDPSTLNKMELENVESIGFEGKEKLGSARGYIWSRTLPLLKDTWLIGNGPDTFIYEFPQQDYLGKWKAYGTTNMLVDKPHNMYLQIAVNQGGVALISFLIMIISYLIQSIKLYAFKTMIEERQMVGIAFMLAIIGYLGAGIFNDSVVSVAPIFWVILGMGMAINFINSHLNKKQEKERLHAVIDIKKMRNH